MPAYSSSTDCISAAMLSPHRSALILLVASTACGPPSPDRDAAGWPFAGEELADPIPLPAGVLTDAEGRPFDLTADTQGFVTLLFFGYTHCPDICPVQMANLAAVLRDLPQALSRRVQVLFVTVDPGRDTPERLRSWLSALHPRFIGLRGEPDVLHSIEDALRLPRSVVETDVETGETFVGHSSQVLAFPADGGPARVAYPWGTRQRDWALDLPRLVRGEGSSPGPS